MSKLTRFVKNTKTNLGRWVKGQPLTSQFHNDAFTAQKLILRHQTVETIFDVGANKGQSIAEYRALYKTANIFSFEPFPDSIEELKKRHGQDKHVTPVPAAVSHQSGTQSFFLSQHTTMNSLLKLADFNENEQQVQQEIIVPTITLDEYAQKESIEHIDILKMDIQGGELQALQGASDLLSNSKIDIVYTEVLFRKMYDDQAIAFQLYEKMHQHGYQMFGYYAMRVNPENNILSHGNALFISPKIAENMNHEYVGSTSNSKAA